MRLFCNCLKLHDFWFVAHETYIGLGLIVADLNYYFGRYLIYQLSVDKENRMV